MVQGQAQGTFQVRGWPGARVRGAGTAMGAEATWPSQQPESWSLGPRGPCPQRPAHSSCAVNTHQGGGARPADGGSSPGQGAEGSSSCVTRAPHPPAR